jgi:hypothetical protein
MMKVTQDNEPLTFTRISLAAQRVTDRLRNPHEQQNEQGERDTNPSRASEKNTGSNREYVEHRLNELRAFERRARGK